MNSASTWRLRFVAESLGMKDKALRQCFTNGALKFSGKDKRATGSGSRVALSRPRAYQAAIMQQLNKNGLSFPLAARLASEFSNVGNVNRAPGECFPHGTTLLVVTPDGATVKNIFADTPHADVSNSACFTTVDCNEIVRRTDAALNKASSND